MPPAPPVGNSPFEDDDDELEDLDMEDGDNGHEPNPYEKDFDAGVDADEDEDPKKFIQQLAGKLSQSLRKYNDEQDEPDVELSKYVAGMVNSQATKGLSEKDVEEILDKIEADPSVRDDDGDDYEDEDLGSDDGELEDLEESADNFHVRPFRARFK